MTGKLLPARLQNRNSFLVLNRNPSTSAVIARGVVFAIVAVCLGWLLGICSGGALFQAFAEPFGLNARENGPATMALFTASWAVFGFLVGALLSYSKGAS